MPRFNVSALRRAPVLLTALLVLIVIVVAAIVIVRLSSPDELPQLRASVAVPSATGVEAETAGVALLDDGDGLVAMSEDLRHVRWRRTGTALFADAVDDTPVLLDQDAGTVSAVDPDTGRVRWTRRGWDQGGAAGTVLISDTHFSSNRTVAVDVASGRILWRRPAGVVVGGGLLEVRVGAESVLASKLQPPLSGPMRYAAFVRGRTVTVVELRSGHRVTSRRLPACDSGAGPACGEFLLTPTHLVVPAKAGLLGVPLTSEATVVRLPRTSLRLQDLARLSGSGRPGAEKTSSGGPPSDWHSVSGIPSRVEGSLPMARGEEPGLWRVGADVVTRVPSYDHVVEVADNGSVSAEIVALADGRRRLDVVDGGHVHSFAVPAPDGIDNGLSISAHVLCLDGVGCSPLASLLG